MLSSARRCMLQSSRVVARFNGSAPTSEGMKPFYALGINIARQVSGQFSHMLSKEELDFVSKGFSDSLLQRTTGDAGFLAEYGPKMNEVMQSRLNNVSDTNRSEGEKFTTEYLAKHPSAVRHPSGLVYHETKSGEGTRPSSDSKVAVHYHGTFVNGEVFDSSVDRGSPVEFQLKEVIMGWQEGIPLMKQGGKATFIVPADLAYGDGGANVRIGPGKTLVFDVELLQVL